MINSNFVISLWHVVLFDLFFKLGVIDKEDNSHVFFVNGEE